MLKWDKTPATFMTWPTLPMPPSAVMGTPHSAAYVATRNTAVPGGEGRAWGRCAVGKNAGYGYGNAIL